MGYLYSVQYGKHYTAEHTISFRRDALVGGCDSPSRTAKRWAFSKGLLSVSMNRSNSGWADGSGIDRVASSTRHAILQHNGWTATVSFCQAIPWVAYNEKFADSSAISDTYKYCGLRQTSNLKRLIFMQYNSQCWPLQFFRRDVFLHFLWQLEQLEECSSMEQVVTSFPEHHGQLLIVVCHCLGNWKLLWQVHQPMNVFNGLVRLLQQGTH